MGAARGRLASTTLAAGLVLGAIGLAAAWSASQPRPSFPVGVPILLAAAAIAVFRGGRAGGVVGLVGLVATALVAARLVAHDQIGQLRFFDGAAVGAWRWLEALGLAVAAVMAVALLIGRPASTVRAAASAASAGPEAAAASETPAGVNAGVNADRRPDDPAVAGRERRSRAVQIAGLLALSALGAELLAAYDDSTGDPGRLLFAVVFFSGLYGAPALLIREVARRNGWRWPSIIMLAFALGIIQPAVIDQALFSTDYRDIESWNQSLQGTFIEVLGFSATNALNFVLGHVIYSFCAPIAIAEAWRPRAANTPWLGPRGIAVAAAAYVATAGLIAADPESHSASAAQLAVSLVVAGLCVGAAILLGRKRLRRPRTGRAPGLPVTLAGSFIVLSVGSAVPETWTGAAITTIVLGAGVVLLGHVSRSTDWSVRHTAAVATGALLSRGVFAFFYYPLIGNISAVPKYAHNIVMLAAVGLAGWIALRKRAPDQPSRPDEAAGPGPAEVAPRPDTNVARPDPR